MEYRIKVETTNSGEKKYIPQVGIPKLSLGRFNHLWLDWYNIISNLNDVSSTKYGKEIHNNQEDALNMIERYKNKLNNIKNSEIKSVEYIKVN